MPHMVAMLCPIENLERLSSMLRALLKAEKVNTEDQLQQHLQQRVDAQPPGSVTSAGVKLERLKELRAERDLQVASLQDQASNGPPHFEGDAGRPDTGDLEAGNEAQHQHRGETVLFMKRHFPCSVVNYLALLEARDIQRNRHHTAGTRDAAVHSAWCKMLDIQESGRGFTS